MPKPPIVPERLQPLGRILDLSADGWTVWDCSPIRGDDGQIHLFACRWRPDDPGVPDRTWFLGSQVVHAVAPTPAGPYRIVDIVLDTDGSARAWDSSGVINPKIYRLRDGRYVLAYTGCSARDHATQAIGLLLADRLDGPWTRLAPERPLIAPAADRSGVDGYICNNPAFLEHPNGEYWIYYKARDLRGRSAEGRPLPGGMRICLATADRLEGPYTKHPANPLIDPHPALFEDPYVWRQDGAYWLLASDMSYLSHGGLIFRSDDGIHWDAPAIAYPEASSFTGNPGLQRLEEPNLLFGADGRPTHLFNVLGAGDADSTWSGHVFALR